MDDQSEHRQVEQDHSRAVTGQARAEVEPDVGIEFCNDVATDPTATVRTL
ncbi:hypothetical protein [Pseudonocardia sp.]|nr:hypothetical protein [Pseudonocardia sp.]